MHGRGSLRLALHGVVLQLVDKVVVRRLVVGAQDLPHIRGVGVDGPGARGGVAVRVLGLDAAFAVLRCLLAVLKVVIVVVTYVLGAVRLRLLAGHLDRFVFDYNLVGRRGL